MGCVRDSESRVYKALDKLEAVLQHNEAPLDTWTPLERQLQLDYGAENAAEFPWLRALRDALRQDTLEKLGK
jgi:putative hydrolase of HD superfamily